jgi:hypothetical protein
MKDNLNNWNLRFITLFTSFLLICSYSLAQSPYGYSQKWFFSRNAGLNFTNGTGALVNGTFLGGGQVNGLAQEASSTITDTSGNVIFYSDSYRIYNGNHTLSATGIRGGTSATDGCAIVPLPGSATRFVLVTAAVDPGGGGDQSGVVATDATRGVHYYLIDKTGLNTATIAAGPTQLSPVGANTEQLCIAPNGDGTGYWIIIYNVSFGRFDCYPITSAGVSGTPVSTTPSPTNYGFQWQGTIKVSKCGTRIANVGWNGRVLTYNFNSTSGVVGTNIDDQTIASPNHNLYGCEFSPDGSKLYFTCLGSANSRLFQLNVGSGSAPTVLASGSATFEYGTLQLGPDNLIYVAKATDNATPAYVGVISNTNTGGVGNFSATGILINAGPGSLPNGYRGMANQPLLNPFLSIEKAISASPDCGDVQFWRPFRNYNRQEVGTVNNSEEWEFYAGQGFQTGRGKTPTFEYTTEGLKTIRVRVTDNTCNKVWTATTTLTISCPGLPVTWLNFEVFKTGEGVMLYWGTAMEKNNERFDVMRSSDGINFTKIGSVEAIGNSNETNNYQFMDQSPIDGIVYYKLIQRDFDGTNSSSDVRSIGEPSDNVVLVSPNPSSSHFNLLVHNPSHLVVIDALGRVVYESDLSNDEGVHSFGHDLPTGNYILKLITADDVQVEKLIKH